MPHPHIAVLLFYKGSILLGAGSQSQRDILNVEQYNRGNQESNGERKFKKKPMDSLYTAKQVYYFSSVHLVEGSWTS